MRNCMVLLTFAIMFGGKASGVPLPYALSSTEWRMDQGSWQQKGELESPLGAQQLRLDGFTFAWNPAAKELSLSRDALSPHRLWSSVPGEPFVLAARGKENVSQSRGSFTFSDRADGSRCFRQTLDRWIPTAEGLRLEGQLSGEGCAIRYQLRFTQAGTKRMMFDLQFFDRQGRKLGENQINRSALVSASHAKESFYGFGQQFSYLDLKGRLVPIFAQEQGHLRGNLAPATFLVNTVSPGAAGAWHTSYTAMPTYLTSDRRGLLLEQKEYLYFDMQRADRVEARAWSSSLRGQIFGGETPLQALEALSEVTGRMPPLPDWFHEGAIIGLMGGEKIVNRVQRELSQRQTPVAAYWLQDWVGKRQTLLGTRLWWNWELDRNAYPNWDAMTARLKAQGIRMLGYINPFLSDTKWKIGARSNLFAEAEQRGYLVRKTDGRSYHIDSGGFGGTLFDFSNPEGRRWLKDILKKELFDRGFSGWMADFGEALPFDAQVASGEAGSRYHHQYLEDWAQFNREIIQEAGQEGEAVAFLRTAALRSPGFTNMFWIGDQMTMWDEHDGLKSSITGLLSSGMSGMPLVHSDIGGFVTVSIIGIKRSEELLYRWTELNAFTGVFRTHEGNDPKGSHQFYDDAKSLDQFSTFAKVFAALFPYRQQFVADASNLGHPLVRHPWLHYPDDREVRGLRYQFMLGPDFMIAPVTEPGQNKVKMYLPAGSWVHLWTGNKLHLTQGAWQEVAAPIGYPAVYFKDDSAAAWEAYRAIQAIAR